MPAPPRNIIFIPRRNYRAGQKLYRSKQDKEREENLREFTKA